MMMKDRVAIVTGASYGLGEATAKLLASRGAIVACVARTLSDLERVVKDIEGDGGRAMAVTCDVREPERVERMIAKVVDDWGRVEVLVNNAARGIPGNKLIENTSLEEYEESLAANLKACYLCIRAVVPIMKRQKYGRIVNVSSFAARFYGRLVGAAYTAAKAGMLGLTRQMAVELGPHGITVNAIAPSIMLTKRAKEHWAAETEERRKAILAGIPLGRIADLREVAGVIAFLASDDASYVTGVCIDVNGGSYMA